MILELRKTGTYLQRPVSIPAERKGEKGATTAILPAARKR